MAVQVKDNVFRFQVTIGDVVGMEVVYGEKELNKIIMGFGLRKTFVLA